MKRKEINSLKEKVPAELKKDLNSSYEELRVLKFDLAAGKVKNVRSINETKKRIARILTFLRAKNEINK